MLKSNYKKQQKPGKNTSLLPFTFQAKYVWWLAMVTLARAVLLRSRHSAHVSLWRRLTPSMLCRLQWKVGIIPSYKHVWEIKTFWKSQTIWISDSESKYPLFSRSYLMENRHWFQFKPYHHLKVCYFRLRSYHHGWGRSQGTDRCHNHRMQG